jgi:hypothetical protein
MRPLSTSRSRRRESPRDPLSRPTVSLAACAAALLRARRRSLADAAGFPPIRQQEVRGDSGGAGQASAATDPLSRKRGTLRRYKTAAADFSSRPDPAASGGPAFARPRASAPMRPEPWIARTAWKTRSLAGVRFPASTSGESSRTPHLAGLALRLAQPPTRRSPLGWRSRFRFHLGGFPDRTFPINGEEKPGSFVAGRLLSVDDLTHAFNGIHAHGAVGG